MDAKRMGLTDKRIAVLCGKSEAEIEDQREKDKIEATYHFVDTCAGEFSAETPYFYSTFGEIDEGSSVKGDKRYYSCLWSQPNRSGARI